MKKHGMLVGKFKFNSYERLTWTLPELRYTLKRCHLKRNRFYLLLGNAQERISWALVDSIRVNERSAEIKPEN